MMNDSSLWISGLIHYRDFPKLTQGFSGGVSEVLI